MVMSVSVEMRDTIPDMCPDCEEFECVCDDAQECAECWESADRCICSIVETEAMEIVDDIKVFASEEIFIEDDDTEMPIETVVEPVVTETKETVEEKPKPKSNRGRKPKQTATKKGTNRMPRAKSVTKTQIQKAKNVTILVKTPKGPQVFVPFGKTAAKSLVTQFKDNEMGIRVCGREKDGELQLMLKVV